MQSVINVPPWLEAYGGVIAAVLSALGIFLVPFTGFMKEWWAYKVQRQAGKALKSDTARAIPGAAIGDSLAMGDLVAAIKDLTAAIRDDTTSDERRGNDRLIAAIESLHDLVGRQNREEHGRRDEPARRRG